MLSIDDIEKRRNELVHSIDVINNIAKNIPHKPKNKWYLDLVIQIGLLKYELNMCLNEFENKLSN